jgi:hypothetical protein
MAGMTTPETVTLRDKNPHANIAWVEIHADGTETSRRGFIWSLSGPVSGVGRAFWVLPGGEGPEGPPGAFSAVLVAVASSRHLCGRAKGRHWDPRGGRYVDKGETYRQPDPRSVFGVREAKARQDPPRRIRLKPMHAAAQTEYDTFVRTVAALTPERT